MRSLVDNRAEGYASPAYAESLADFGEPVFLPGCGGFLLRRRIPGTDEFDAMGCYPLFCCQEWSRLGDDLAKLPADIVSVALVADPFGDYTTGDLEAVFDCVVPYKEHFLVDLDRALEETGTKQHRKQALKALRKMRIEVCPDPASFSGEWDRLYDHLRLRYDIRGIRSFSKRSFEAQLNMPGIVVLQAIQEDRLVGAQLYFTQGDVVHCHLGAVSAEGYATGAFYAMDYFSYEYFAGRGRWLDLGGGAGIHTSPQDGLSQYKRRWSSMTRPVYFCGRILNHARYEQLARALHPEETTYFPVYRAGEFS